MGFLRKNFQAIKDIWWTVSAIWVVLSAVPTAAYMCFRGIAGEPPEVVVIRGLALFSLILLAVTLVRYNLSYQLIDMVEDVDQYLPGVMWQIRVGKRWDGVGGRRILAACAKCRTGMHVAMGAHANCDECAETHGSHKDFESARDRILAKWKFKWENGEPGFEKVFDSQKAE